MILAITYSVKGVKKGYKKYQAHQLEKKQASKGTLPDLEDPSRELDATCHADTSTLTIEDTRSTKSSESTGAAEKALENDPEFQRYMEKHRNLYLSQSKGLPPAYEATMSQTELPAPLASPTQNMSSPVSDGEHCICHNCIAARQNSTPVSATSLCTRNVHVQELPAPMAPIVELDVPGIRINNDSHILKSSTSQDDEEGELVLCEMPGDLPAILPERRSPNIAELPAPA